MKYTVEGRQARLTFLYEAPEAYREYTYLGGDRLRIKGVKEARATAHGYHHLTLEDGTVRIIAPGWIALELPGKGPTPEEFKKGGGAWDNFGRSHGRPPASGGESSPTFGHKAAAAASPMSDAEFKQRFGQNASPMEREFDSSTP